MICGGSSKNSVYKIDQCNFKNYRLFFIIFVNFPFFEATNDTIYLGCYNDYFYNPDMILKAGIFSNLTIRECILLCYKLNYKYAGLQNG